MSEIKTVDATSCYVLQIVLTNGNMLSVGMEPFLNTVQLCSLKDMAIFKTARAQGMMIVWDGNMQLELSVSTLLCYFKCERFFGAKSAIAKAETSENYILHLALNNGNELKMHFKELLRYTPFTPLSEKSLWNSMMVKEYSLEFKTKGTAMELSTDKILQYFA